MTADASTTPEHAARPAMAGIGVTSVVFAEPAAMATAVGVARQLLGRAPGERLWFFVDHEPGAESQALDALLALKDEHIDRVALGVVMPREPGEAELLSGRLDEARITAIASRLFDARQVQEYVVCGTASFEREVRSALTALGVDASRVRAASAAAAASATAECAPSGPAVAAGDTQVSFVMDGRRQSFVMRTGNESILDAAMRAGIELPFSCKAGVCSTCRTKLVRGEVDLAENYALEDWELAQGFILACQARAKTPQIELTYDET